MEFTHEVYNSVDRYFSVLTHSGYKSYAEVYNLIILTFIEEMLCGPMSEFITEEDYKYITGSLQCLYGSCMIPFPDYKKGMNDKVFGAPYSCRVKTKV